MKPTKEFYEFLQKLYNYYNVELFKGELEEIMFTVTRKRKTMGYFMPNSWGSDKYNKKVGELAMNPIFFKKYPIEETLSTLVHEMCHVWQFQYGYVTKAVRKGYHNKAWANKMIEVGLMPSDTGKEGGKKTGYMVADYVIENGPFFKVTKKILTKYDFLNLWHDAVIKSSDNESPESPDATEADKEQDEEDKPKTNIKVKYSCGCSNVWGKPGLLLFCGAEDCGAQFNENIKQND